MTWDDALEIAVARTKHERYRDLCADSYPDHEMWRAEMIRQAAEEPEYPSLLDQAGNAIGAVARAVGAIVTGQPITVSDEVYDARTATCMACDHYDAAQGRCKACGCLSLKRWGAQERCPLDPPKWEAIVRPASDTHTAD